MIRVPMKSNAKWAHLRLQEKLLRLFGPCGAFIRLSWALICPCFLVTLMFTHVINYKLPLFFGCHVPIASEYLAWTLVNAPISAVFIGAILATVKIRKSGKLSGREESMECETEHRRVAKPKIVFSLTPPI
ncbi:unnamed protein product, partial [Haemonchus placei]|uniref:G_PROTEIN_RECEP_F1_2 domain-containing protein n=1 Tax=Haemonchus placei TaxID=6290 RepID=A0A0N4VYD4_HAEPC